MLRYLAVLLLSSNLHPCDTVGFKNFNPGNLIAHGCKWESAKGKDQWGHLQFETQEEGLEAIRQVLHTYKRRYKICTLERLCGRWVSSKADQAGKRDWLRTVRQRVKSKPGQKLDFDDPETAIKIAHGVVYAENSCDELSDSLYRAVFFKEVKNELVLH